MIQVHEIVEDPTSEGILEDKVNQWVQANKNVEIIDIKYGITSSISCLSIASGRQNHYTVSGALIMYEK